MRNEPAVRKIENRKIKFLDRAQDFYRGKRILVPGGAGFIGSRLTKRLLSLGAIVTVVDPLEKFCGGHVFNLHSHLKNIQLVRKKIETYIQESNLKEVSCIFNCVGLSDHHLGFLRPELDYRINCYSGVKLLQKLAKDQVPAKIVSIGSRSQYGQAESKVNESAPLKPLDVQSVHKTALEQYHTIYGSSFGVDFVFLRLTNTYGPGQRMRGNGIGFVGEIIRNSIGEKEVIIYGGLDRVKDLIYVEDVVDALICAGMLEEKSTRIYNVGGRACRVGELIECLKKEIPSIRVRIQEFPPQIKKVDTGDVVLNSGTFSRATGWHTRTTIKEGITSTIKYYRSCKRYYW